MITDGLISLPIAVLNALIGLLPTYTGFPVSVDNALTTMISFTSSLGDIFPVGDMFTALALIMTIEIAIMGFNTLAWLAHWRQK